uniref:Plexin-A4 n=2 Tax=Cacopsylla melanoneura TaxID=428564 RepID=A0A8D8Y476_9HEMI
MWWSAFLVLLAASFGAGASNSAQDVVRTFSSENGAGSGRFNHLVVNKVTGQIYVGAVNQLYQLTQDLEMVQSEMTGPQDDSTECSVMYCPNTAVKRPTDNHNKALVIDYTTTRLITCGSIQQGTCTVRSLQNISDIVQNVREAVVANNAKASTFAFIAPGPPKPPSTHVMYVGVTFTGNSPYRSEVPSIASRSLDPDRMFQIADVAVTTGTRMFVNNLARERYIINYVYGFESVGFSYFLTTQLRSNIGNSPYISKLVRICHDDPNYYSYTEIPITCNSNSGKQYNLVQAGFVGKPGSDLAKDMGITAQDDVLFAVFAESENPEGEGSNRPKNSSALCIYSLASIRRKFMQNIKACFSGQGNRGLDFISPGHACVQTKLQTIGEDFCGLDVNTPLGGEQPIEAVAVLNFSVRTTAVAATSTGDYTVVFIGTENGHLKKVVVKNSSNASEYEDVTIDEGATVIADLHMDLNEEHLYVMTERRISKLLQECEVFKTCMECRRDPYCGWCTLEDKCTNLSICRKATIRDHFSWVSLEGGSCNGITSVTPDNTKKLFLITVETISEIPLNTYFFCIFTFPNEIVSLLGSIKNGTNQITCQVPDEEKLLCTSGQNKTTAKLTLRKRDESFLSTATSVQFNCKAIIPTIIVIVDCKSYQNCTQCTSSAGSKCSWYHSDQYCATIVKQDNNSISDSSYCPRIIKTFNSSSSEILVPADTLRSIEIPINRSSYAGTRFFSDTPFACSFNIEGTRKPVNAQFSTLNANVITCNPMKFSYMSRLSNINASLTVSWVGYDGFRKPLDNPDNVYVNIYRCRDFANNCGHCLNLNEKYGCGWCQSSNSCEISERCDQTGSWIDRTRICPNPKITSFEPKSGPLEGGTNVTIHGINLGKTFDDIEDGVRVAGITCHPYPNLYQPSTQIVCQMGPFKTVEAIVSENMTGPVTVHIGENCVQSKDKYQFVDPVIRSIYPLQGPRSGGTILHITGAHMNAGSRIEAFIDELPCRIISVEPELAHCVTSASDRQRMGKLMMKFDKGSRTFEGSLYEYVDDPTIESVESGIQSGQGVKFPKGTPAGGTNINVVGKNLLYIKQPLIYVVYKGKRYVSGCEVMSNNYMKCTAPTITGTSGPINEEHPEQVEYGFEMDNVTSVQNLSRKLNSPYLLYPDPIYEPFGEEIKYYKNDYLTINGQHLDRASQESDVIVRIGIGYCNVTSVSRLQLTCRPPAEQPLNSLSDDEEEGSAELPDVTVIVGNNLKFYIGKLSYSQPAALNSPLTKTALYGGIAIITILFLVFIAFLVAYRRKSTENTRVLKNMQEQMDILELRVAAECKEAFAELQTEITDLTGDLTTGGIPFLDYRTYAMMILFPNSEHHAVLQFERPELLHKEKGLRLFGQLIMNKTFLLLFIRTLESNRYFSMRDRVNVASLIMVTLQSKMEYCTDILKTLLAELIEKCMEGKSHPKLLLRRTESVAEKMLSSWFTFLLYKFLRECAGEPLYLLFRAMKQQVDKGPVDAITAEARYSLSEEKLIRHAIDFKPMTVYVSVNGYENIGVKVLDCDTISQVKEKSLDTIYRALPYSQRPRKDDLDVEWRTGNTGRLILYDYDTTTKVESEWKKVNTLNHYRVPDGGCLTLVSKQYNLSIMSEKTDKYETLNLSKMGRNTSPLNRDNDGMSKEWHLVKHHDNDSNKEGERSNKMVSEIYLTRLLATKGTLQKFVDDLFETIFSTEHRSSALSFSIKYMFDFLDEQGTKHRITDPDVVHIWKTNALPLRFWVNLIKNPNFLLDIQTSSITVDSCLSGVAQALVSACSTSDHKLSEHSPSSSFIFAREIPGYKDMINKYYSEIKSLQKIEDQDMNAMLAEESQIDKSQFNTNWALHELYTYVTKYNEQLTVALDEDLAQMLEEVHSMMKAE